MTCRAPGNLAWARIAQRDRTSAPTAAWASRRTTPWCTNVSRELTRAPASRPGARPGRSAQTLPLP